MKQLKNMTDQELLKLAEDIKKRIKDEEEIIKEVKVKRDDIIMVPAKVVGIHTIEGLGTTIKLSIKNRNGYYFLYVEKDHLYTTNDGHTLFDPQIEPIIYDWWPVGINIGEYESEVSKEESE